MSGALRQTCYTSAAAFAITAATCAHAAVTISTAPTLNMNCAGGTCSPTATSANLNVTDLENDLASGNLIVTTTGSGGIQANDIQVGAGVSWVSVNALTLDAYHSINVGAPIAITGGGGLTVVTNDGGTGGIFNFAPGDNVDFYSLSSSLTINGVPYALENSVATLASAIASNSAGNYALANNYNATGDGTYKNAAIPSEFSGSFEGLGNTISNLSIVSKDIEVGLFAKTGFGGQSGGSIENIVLQNANVAGKGVVVGALVAVNTGTISGAFASGSVTSSYYRHSGPTVGMLVGANDGPIARSGAAGNPTATSKRYAAVGGLTGSNNSTIIQSYADCVGSAGEESESGGLTSSNTGSISHSYALGSTHSGYNSDLGGLVGENAEQSTIAQSYSTTAVKDEKSAYRGGLIGLDYSPPGSNTSAYWDTTTSQVKNRKDGAGKPKSDPGITGLTTTQLQAGLPSGFDPTEWAENPSINGGFPYLINNPPR